MRGIIEGGNFPGNYWTVGERENIVRLLNLQKANHYMFVIHHFSGSWKQPLAEEIISHLKHVIELCTPSEISVNVGISLAETFNPNSMEDINFLTRHFESVIGLGVFQFSFLFDRIKKLNEEQSQMFKSLAQAQVSVVNGVISSLKETLKQNFNSKTINPQFYFYPSYAYGDIVLKRTELPKTHYEYWKEIGRTLESSTCLFFHGPFVVSDHVTCQFIETLRAICYNRKIVLWDHFPSDPSNLLSFTPYEGREKNLYKELVGIVFNPRNEQVESAIFSLYSGFDYIFNPQIYDPDKSIRTGIRVYVEDDRITEDILYLISFLQRPKTASQSVWTRKSASQALFLDLQNRINHIRKSSIPPLVQRILHSFLEFVSKFCEKQLHLQENSEEDKEMQVEVQSQEKVQEEQLEPSNLSTKLEPKKEEKKTKKKKKQKIN